MARNGLAKAEPYLWQRYMMFQGKLLHRLIWERESGSIPKGYLVHHRNGDGTDNRIENLELISRADHCALHLPRLGYRAEIKVKCEKCGRQRTDRDINSNPYRRKCSPCRGEEDRRILAKRRNCYEPCV